MSSMKPAKTDGFKRKKLGEKERKKRKKKKENTADGVMWVGKLMFICLDANCSAQLHNVVLV